MLKGGFTRGKVLGIILGNLYGNNEFKKKKEDVNRWRQYITYDRQNLSGLQEMLSI